MTAPPPTGPGRADDDRRARDLVAVTMLLSGIATVVTVAYLANPLLGAAVTGCVVAVAGLLLGLG